VNAGVSTTRHAEFFDLWVKVVDCRQKFARYRPLPALGCEPRKARAFVRDGQQHAALRFVLRHGGSGPALSAGTG